MKYVRTRKLIATSILVSALSGCADDEAPDGHGDGGSARFDGGAEADGSTFDAAAQFDASAQLDGRVSSGDAAIVSRCTLPAAYAYNTFSPLRGYGAATLLTPPASYRREAEGGDAGVLCDVLLPPCGSGQIDSEEITAALGAPEVASALASGDTTYGRTYSLVSDQGYFFIQRVDGGVLRIGAQCDDAECRRVPESVAAVQQLLMRLDIQQLDGGACAVR